MTCGVGLTAATLPWKGRVGAARERRAGVGWGES
jgi:hypothetical protein